MNGLITLAVGVLAGWLTTAIYYRKSTRDQRRLIAKIPEEIRTALREDQRNKLTVKELNELMELKTLDKRKRGLEAFKACPKCGSPNISIREEWEVDSPDSAWQFNIVECKDCHWSKDDLSD